MTKLIQRFKTAVTAGQTAMTKPLPKPDIGAHPLKTKNYILALIMGQTLEEAQSIAKVLAKTAQESDAKVVLVTDQTAVAFYQIENCLTEYLPPIESLADINGIWSANTYLAKRLEVLTRKWEPIKTIPFGETSLALVDSGKTPV